MMGSPGKNQLAELRRFGRDPQSYFDSYAKNPRFSSKPYDWGDWHNLSKSPWPLLRSLQRRGLMELRATEYKHSSNAVFSRLLWQARVTDEGRRILELYGLVR